MKVKSIVWSILFVSLAMTISTGCTTYKSVKATTLLGKNLEGQTKELGNISKICTWATTMNYQYLDCATESEGQTEYQRAAKVISAYGAELEKLVGDQQDLDYGTEISSIVKGFTSVDWSKVANDATMQGKLLAPLKSIAGLFVDVAVKKELYKVITTTDPHFQNMRKDIDLEFSNRAEALKSVGAQINEDIKRDSLNCSRTIADPASPQCTDACDVRLILGCRDFRGMATGWEDDYKKALFAFIDAHHKLREGFSTSGALRDTETYKNLLDAVKAVYGPGNSK